MSFAITAVALTAVFVLSLAGIASTQGTIERSGPAATLAARQGDAETVPDRRECRRGGERGSRGADGRV